MKYAVIDFESDPFAHGRVPRVFCADFFDGVEHVTLWDDDEKKLCERLLQVIGEYDGLVYAHNGGKFDFHYLIKYGWGEIMTAPVTVLGGGRVAEFRYRRATVRDSYALLPVPLSAYAKDKIDYTKLERSCRDRHRDEILHYLRKDTEYLREFLAAADDLMGLPLTIASASFGACAAACGDTPVLSDTQDALIRAWYRGGRVQCFEKGVIRGGLKYYDLNSAYPWAMTCELPVTNEYKRSTVVTPTGFYLISGTGEHCAEADYRAEHGQWHMTGHEVIAARAAGWRCKIDDGWIPAATGNYAPFVKKFHALKEQASREGDKTRRLLYKLILNSCYGKFAINPDRFREYQLTASGQIPEARDRRADESRLMAAIRCWRPHYDDGNFSVWSRESLTRYYYNVAVGASITGLVRARLITATAAARRPLYCDTDSLVCEGGVVTGAGLGEWALEREGRRMDIAGKKLYCFYNADGTHKIASKGIRASADDIKKLCKGEKIVYKSPVPTYSINRSKLEFLQREVTMT